MAPATLSRFTCITFVKASLARIPIAIVAYPAVVKLTLDQDVADIAVILGIHLDKTMLAFSITYLSLRKTITTNIVVAVVTLLAVRVGAAYRLIADITIEADFPGGILDKVGKVFCVLTVALLCVAFINAVLDKEPGNAACGETTSCC